VATETNLITSFVRRIGKYFSSSVSSWYRPRSVEPGLNHIDDPSAFDEKTIYKGEEIVDLDTGRLFTQDGAEIVELNTDNSILEGMLVRNPSASVSGGPLWLTVESGSVRINGRTYWHQAASASGDVQINPNTDLNRVRIDVITASSGYPVPATGVSGMPANATEYAAQINYHQGTLAPSGRPLSFQGLGTTGSSTLNFVSGADSVQGIQAGDILIGPGLTQASVATVNSSYLTISGSLSIAPEDETYSVAVDLGGISYGFAATGSTGSNIITKIGGGTVIAGDYVYGPGVPLGTQVQSVTGTSITISSPLSVGGQATYGIADAADIAIYNPITIPNDEVVLAVVVVPANYDGSSSAHKLRPISVSQLWSTFGILAQDPPLIIESARKNVGYYQTDSSYISDQFLIDRLGHEMYQVVRNHYSITLDQSVTSGDIVPMVSAAAGGTGGGGGGVDIAAGTGIQIDYPAGVGTTGVISWTGVTVADEGTVLGDYYTLNFIGTDVQAIQGSTSTWVNIYIPPLPFASHYNTTDGTTTGTVSRALSNTGTYRVSSPTTEGNPYNTNGWDNGVVRPVTNDPSAVYSTGGLVTGFSQTSGGDATITVDVYDADEVTLIATYTTSTIYQNATFTSSGTAAGITVAITGYTSDSGVKWMAQPTVTVDMDALYSAALGFVQGGRYSVTVTMNTDTATDGGGTYSYSAPSIFYDKNPSTPSISGGMSITESGTAANVLTKHLSGVEYYILSSQFNVSVTGIANPNRNTQGSPTNRLGNTGNFGVTGSEYGLSTLALAMWSPTVGSFTGWDNFYDTTGVSYAYLGWPVTSSSYRYRGSGANGLARADDPWSAGSVLTGTTASILIDTYTTTSTALVEYFDDEARRTTFGWTATWDSTQTLGTGTTAGSGVGGTAGGGTAGSSTGTTYTWSEACVVGGKLVKPERFFLTDPSTSTIQPNLTTFKPDKNGANPNYGTAGYTGANFARYYREFRNSSAGNTTPIFSFTVVFSGTWSGANALADLTNNLLVFKIKKIASPGGSNSGIASPWLYLSGPAYNFATFDDGATDGQVRTGLSSGNTIYGSFGGFNCYEGIWVELEIFNSSIQIETITLTFTT
jgi:hypothetical protein